TWFYSRSRQELWHKGATSGNTQQVENIQLDCDQDALLITVSPAGPACHTGEVSCFHHALKGNIAKKRAVVHTIIDTIEDRLKDLNEGSYTTFLFSEVIDKVLKKVRDVTAAVLIGAIKNDKGEIKRYIADFIYHSLVLMNITDVTLSDIKQVLYVCHIE